MSNANEKTPEIMTISEKSCYKDEDLLTATLFLNCKEAEFK